MIKFQRNNNNCKESFQQFKLIHNNAIQLTKIKLNFIPNLFPMPKQIYLWLAFLSLILFKPAAINAQTGPNDTILLGGVVLGRDTLGVIYLPEVDIYGQMSPERRAELHKLRYNVYKVYPYAITAAYVLQKVDNELAKQKKKKDRKTYIKEVEKEMNLRFKDELKNLTITQGKILVKLINRETGRDCYDIIKEIKGGLNARIYQTTAFFFDNNLKRQYDPFNEDKDIEMIVQEIEAKHYVQPQRLALPKKLTNQ